MADFSHLSIVAGLFVMIFLSWRDLSGTETSQNLPNIQKEIKTPRMAQLATPTIKFLFCYSWGYKRVFEQYAHAISERFPNLAVEGDNYPPPASRALFAQVLSFAKILIIAMVVVGQNPFPHLNMETPSIFTWAIENKLYACLMIFFISNAIEGQLISTGAFEVAFNDVPVWSKLETGRIPSAQEMFQIIENHMQFGQQSS